MVISPWSFLSGWSDDDGNAREAESFPHVIALLNTVEDAGRVDGTRVLL